MNFPCQRTTSTSARAKAGAIHTAYIETLRSSSNSSSYRDENSSRYSLSQTLGAENFRPPLSLRSQQWREKATNRALHSNDQLSNSSPGRDNDIRAGMPTPQRPQAKVPPLRIIPSCRCRSALTATAAEAPPKPPSARPPPSRRHRRHDDVLTFAFLVR